MRSSTRPAMAPRSAGSASVGEAMARNVAGRSDRGTTGRAEVTGFTAAFTVLPMTLTGPGAPGNSTARGTAGGERTRPVRRTSLARFLVVTAAAGCLVLGLAGCGKGEFEDRTAVVELGGQSTSFDIDDCGRDGTTIYVVGQSSGGEVLQAVLGVKADKTTGVPSSSGITFGADGQPYAAFGVESWSRRGGSGPAPGRVTSARLRGSRVQIAGEVAEVDQDDSPTTPARRVPFSLDARCDQK